MFFPDAYQLLDFGEGRRLERFGGLSLDRPCPTVQRVPKSDLAAWAMADARFERAGATEGKWIAARGLPERWTIAHGPITLELNRTEFGHLGVFPEQVANWDWIAAQVRAASRPLRVLNLFAYTAGSTLAAAAAGAEVVHVDAARNVVAWGRRNAELSRMVDAPIRWIAEDAVKFASRELRRQSRYDAVILDPPSFGRGPHGEVWQLSKHLHGLLSLCAQLTAGRPRFVLLTCHTPDFTLRRLKGMVLEALGAACPGRITSCPLTLQTSAGRELPSGVAVRWEAAMEPGSTKTQSRGLP